MNLLTKGTYACITYLEQSLSDSPTNGGPMELVTGALLDIVHLNH